MVLLGELIGQFSLINEINMILNFHIREDSSNKSHLSWIMKYFRCLVIFLLDHRIYIQRLKETSPSFWFGFLPDSKEESPLFSESNFQCWSIFMSNLEYSSLQFLYDPARPFSSDAYYLIYFHVFLKSSLQLLSKIKHCSLIYFASYV